MPKLKTRKAVIKRIKIKKNGKNVKMIIRKGGQDHFNARENGKTKRAKRNNKQMALSHKKNILSAVPYIN